MCGNTDSKPLWQIGKSIFARCTQCRLVFQNPQPEFSGLKQRYSDEYFQYEIDNQNNFLSLMLKSLDDMNFKVEKGQGKTFMDIGCATGALLEYVKKFGWNTQGIEICEQSAQYARDIRKVNVFTGPLEDWQGPPETIDVIHSSHVIEHVPDPRYFIKRSASLLKKGGSLFCTTPNISGFQARIFGSEWRSVIEDHLTLFSKPILMDLIESEGFKIQSMKTWGGLAAGTAPAWLKKLADPLAKKTGLGDVMIIHALK